MINFIIDTHFINLIFQKTGKIITEEEIKNNLWKQLFYWLNQDNVINAECLLNDMEQMFIDDMNNFNLAKGKIHFSKGEYHKSSSYYIQILRMVDKNHLLTQTLNMLAKNIEYLKPQSNEYSSLLYTSYQINPDDSSILLHLGNYFISSKEYDKAKECYGKLETIDPKHKFLDKNRGLLYECQYKYREALSYFYKYKKLVEQQHDTNETKYVYSKIMQYAQRLNKICLALSFAKKLVKLEADYSNLFKIANCYNRLGNHLKAKKYCEEALTKTQDCNIKEIITFSLDIAKIRLRELDIANFNTRLYTYHSIMNLWGLYETSDKDKKTKSRFKAVFSIVVKNAYRHHHKQDIKPPQIMYKYVSLKKCLRILKALRGEYLYLSSVESFNDPFDPPIKKADDYNEFRELLGDIRIGCLSLNWDSILMWSHYADNHKGICIGYDMSNILSNKFNKENTILKECIYIDNLYLNEFSAILDNVNYRDTEPFKNNIFRELSFLDMYSIKHKNWEYEKEWRIISHNTKNKIVLPIREIYFGLDIKHNQKEFFVKYIQKLNKNHIKLFEIIKQEHLYCLQKKVLCCK